MVVMCSKLLVRPESAKVLFCKAFALSGRLIKEMPCLKDKTQYK